MVSKRLVSGSLLLPRRPFSICNNKKATRSRIALCRGCGCRSSSSSCSSSSCSSSSNNSSSRSSNNSSSSSRSSSRCWLSTASTTTTKETKEHWQIRFNQRTNLIFGANTDVGKTIVTTGLCRAGLSFNNEHMTTNVHYIKPMACGSADDEFVQRYCGVGTTTTTTTTKANNLFLSTNVLFQWETPASPHVASRFENKPCSDPQVLTALHQAVTTYAHAAMKNENDESYLRTWIETAGGVLSPAAASPQNTSCQHAKSMSSPPSPSPSSPSPSLSLSSWGWMPQADLYQSLVGICPVVLVGDGRLGGISATLSALESLIVRGYQVDAIVFLQGPHEETAVIGQNAQALREYVSGRKVALRSGSGQALFNNEHNAIVSLPPIPQDAQIPLDDWYVSDQVTETFAKLDMYLQNAWEVHVANLERMREQGRQVFWWPFTQHGTIQTDDNVTLINSASGDHYHVLSTAPVVHDHHEEATTDGVSTTKPTGRLECHALFDACASWWTQGVGHGNSSMALASAAAAGRYGHVLFPDVVHAPALALARKLLGPSGPGHSWANRVFFTDNGSTGMEVAIKMAFKLYETRVSYTGVLEDVYLDCVAQTGSYHGDTLGAMNLSGPSIFNEGQHPWYEPRGLFLEPPTLGFRQGRLSVQWSEGQEMLDDLTTEFNTIQEAMDVRTRMLRPKLMSVYKELIDLSWVVYEHKEVTSKIGCAVIEPVLMGAGGMTFVDPLWQRALMDVARSKKVPIVFDEVASGLHRVGVTSCREILGANPDIACYAKLLTGGLLPLSVTLASKEVFESFLGHEKSQALLHGHSYTANPIGCVAALHALEAYDNVLDKRMARSGPQMLFDETQVRELSLLPLVEQSFTLGTVLAVTIKPEQEAGDYAASSRTVPIAQELRKNGVYARPLGNVIYIMASPLTSKEECAQLTDKLGSILRDQPLTVPLAKTCVVV